MTEYLVDGVRYRAGKRVWTAEDDARLRAMYPHAASKDVALACGRSLSAICGRATKLRLLKSAEHLASPAACRLRRGDHVGAPFRFPKGHVPANKGMRRPGWSAGRMRETQFKRGERRGISAKNWRPIGTILIDHDGYSRVKVREANRGEATGFGNVRVWPLLQRHVWEQLYGPIPIGHVVAFRDGSKSNCAPENLELVDRVTMMRRNTVHNLPKPVAQTVQLLGALNRQIRKRQRAREKQN